MHARLKSKFYLQFYRRHRLFSHLLSVTVPKIIIRHIYQTFSCSDFFFHRIFVYSLFQIRTYGATQPIGKNRRGTSRRIFDFQRIHYPRHKLEEWKNGVGPIDVWDNNKEDLVNKIMNFAASIGDNPNAVGKDSNIWDLAYMTIMLRNMP